MNRWTGPKTVRLTAHMGPHEVVALVDSGSPHNFINSRLANLLKPPVVPTEAFFVWAANGEQLQSHGHYDKVLSGVTRHSMFSDLFFSVFNWT